MIFHYADTGQSKGKHTRIKVILPESERDSTEITRR